MNISKKTSLAVLGVTSIVCSRTLFALFNDPEGPNLLIVFVMAVILYVPSLALYFYYPSTKLSGLKRLLSSIFIQILSVTALYFFLS